jgi:hypothetical protein
MALREEPESVDRADALVCRSAVLLLRAGQDTAVTGRDLAPSIDHLLSAVSLALETGRPALPAAVRGAAVQLAEHLVRRSSIPVPGVIVGEAQPGSPRSPHRGSAPSEHGAAVPFVRSIRLGRMG